MGRERSSLVLLKLSPADQALYNAEMQSLQQPDPEFDWGGAIQRYRDAQTKLTDFDPDMMVGSESGLTFGDFYDQYRESSKQRQDEIDIRSLRTVGYLPQRPSWWETMMGIETGTGKPNLPIQDVTGVIPEIPEAKDVSPPQTKQTILGQYHPRWPNPHDKAWVEGSDERPSGAYRVTPTHTGEDRLWIDPKTGESKSGNILIQPKLLTEGHPVLEADFDNSRFEGTGVESHERRFPILTKPGFFATGPSLSDISNITTSHSWGDKPNMVAIRGKPQDEDVWIRSAKEAPEDLHELYYMEHQPASKLYDPFALIPGRKNTQRMIAEQQGEEEYFDPITGEDESKSSGFGLDRKHVIQALATRLSESPIPALSAGLDREGKPMTLTIDEIEYAMYNNFGEHTSGLSEFEGTNHITEMIDRMQHPRKGHSIKGEHPSDIDETYRTKYNIDIMDALHIPSIYHKEDTQHGIMHGDMRNYQTALFKILEEKYDIPHELFAPHMQPEHWTEHAFGSHVAGSRFLYNAAKASGWDFHPTQKIPYPKDEHGWPMTHRNEQMSGNALKLLFSDEVEERKWPRSQSKMKEHARAMRRGQTERNPIFGPIGEEKITQPPTTTEWRELNREMEVSRPHEEPWWVMGHNYHTEGLTPELENMLIDLRQRKKGGIGNETV